MATLLRTPAYNPGLTTLHNSFALAAFSPLVFEWTRRDYEVVSVAENGGRSNQLDIVIAGNHASEFTADDSVWLSAAGFFAGLVVVIGATYSVPNTTITTTALKNAAATAEYDFINLMTARPNYRMLATFTGVDGNTGNSTGEISTAVLRPGPGPLFRMSVDAGQFTRAELDLTDLPEWDTSTRQQLLSGRGVLFYISYSELWDGNTPSASITDNFLLLPIAHTARDRHGESGIGLEVWENSLSDTYKPVLANALPDPVFFRGWPFFAGFGKVDTDLPTWQLIQSNNFGPLIPSTQSATAFIPDGGFHLVSAQDVTGEPEFIQMWLEAGVFWSFWVEKDTATAGSWAFAIALNFTSGTAPTWLFEDGGTASGSLLIGAYGFLDDRIQEVKVTTITADQVVQFSSILYDNYIYGELSFLPCSSLSLIALAGQSKITRIVGPATTATNLTSTLIDTCAGLGEVDFSQTTIISGSFQIKDCVALTNIALPTVPAYPITTFTISGCTSFAQLIPMGIKFPNLMNINSCTVDLSANGWNATTVDYYLAQLDEACGYGYTGRTINISGNTAPTAASLGNLTSLALKGVTVTTD